MSAGISTASYAHTSTIRSAIPGTSVTYAAAISITATIAIATAVSIPAPATVIPRPSADEQPARKPLRPVIPIRRAGIRRIAVVPISASRSHRHANANPDTHPNLSLRRWNRKTQRNNRRRREILEVTHK